MQQQQQLLTDLIDRLKQAFDSQLVSVILYGSGATEDWDEDKSDLNILCVLERISAAELRRVEPVLKWWADRNRPGPLLLTAEEVRTSTDCFPIEFHDMREHRHVLYGEDVIRELVVDNKFYRAQVEHEMRAKQLRLRQRAAEVLSQPERLGRLMTDSVSTFCVLGRHALILHGSTPYWRKRDVVAALESAMGRSLPALSEILAIRRADNRSSAPEMTALLERYLTDVAALVHFVDTLAA